MCISCYGTPESTAYGISIKTLIQGIACVNKNLGPNQNIITSDCHTTKNRSATGSIRTEGGASNSGKPGVTASFGGVTACGAKRHAGANGPRVGRRTGNYAATPVWVFVSDAAALTMVAERKKLITYLISFEDEFTYATVSSGLGREAPSWRSIDTAMPSLSPSMTAKRCSGSICWFPRSAARACAFCITSWDLMVKQLAIEYVH